LSFAPTPQLVLAYNAFFWYVDTDTAMKWQFERLEQE